MSRLDDFVWVFIGCGGTFYGASPYLAVLRKRYGCGKSILVDPDVIEAYNLDRQWPQYHPGGTKVGAAAQALGESEAWQLCNRFSLGNEVIDRETDGKPVLAIVNVDNDDTRLEVAEWLASRESTGIMAVSGCERTHGQCYPGIWHEGRPIFDWRKHHLDVGESSRPTHACNIQTIRANALTGTLVGMCTEEMIVAAGSSDYSDSDAVLEYYWKLGITAGLRVWRTVVACEGKEVKV